MKQFARRQSARAAALPVSAPSNASSSVARTLADLRCKQRTEPVPPEPYRVGTGFGVGVYNSRDVHSRGEGGAQERELAAKYGDWAQRPAFDYPYVGTTLESIATN